MKTPARVHLVLIFVQITFGSWAVFGKWTLQHIAPFVLADLRVLGAIPLFFIVARVGGSVRVAARDVPLLIVLGILGVGANQLLYIVGLAKTSATNAGILMPSIPVFTVALAALFGIERLGWRRGFGVFVAVGGAIVMLDPLRASFDSDHLVGNLLIVSNCLAYAGYVVLQRGIVQRVRPLVVTAWAYLFGGIFALAIAGPALLEVDLGSISRLVWLAIIYVIVLPTTVNYALVSWAIKHSSPSLVATYTTLQPVTSAILAAIVLGEEVRLIETLGFVLIIAGLFIVARAAEPRAS